MSAVLKQIIRATIAMKKAVGIRHDELLMISLSTNSLVQQAITVRCSRLSCNYLSFNLSYRPVWGKILRPIPWTRPVSCGDLAQSPISGLLVDVW